MGLRGWLRTARRIVGRALRSVSLASEEAARIIFGIRPTLSGVTVSDSTALEATAYFAGVRNVAEDLATLPLHIYRRLGPKRREIDRDFRLYPVFHEQPNEEMDIVQFVEMTQAWAMMRRNAYAEIVRDGQGRALALWPIPPNRVTVERFEGDLVYTIRLPNGQRDPQTGLPFSVLNRSQVFHLKAFTLDGVLGLSSIEKHQEAIGLALALDRYGAAFFGNDGTPSGYFTVPGGLSEPAYLRMKQDLIEPNQGLANKHRTQLLEEGMKFESSSVPNDQAQFLDSKRHQTEEMARLNRIAPHKIGDLSRATFDNIEHQSIDHVVSTIRPHAVRWEKAILTQVFTRDERRSRYPEFLLDGLLRGDAKTRAEALAIKRQNGIVNADEWRALDNENPIEDGSGRIYLVNGNMISVAQAGNPRAPKDGEGRQYAARVFRPLFLAAAERCIRKEAAAVRKAVERSSDLARLDAWATKFYREQQATVRQSFGPIALAVGEAVRGEEGPDLGEWADEYVAALAGARSRAALGELREVVTSGSSDLAGAVGKLAEKWIQEEPARLAEREAEKAIESVTRHIAQDPGVAA